MKLLSQPLFFCPNCARKKCTCKDGFDLALQRIKNKTRFNDLVFSEQLFSKGKAKGKSSSKKTSAKKSQSRKTLSKKSQSSKTLSKKIPSKKIPSKQLSKAVGKDKAKKLQIEQFGSVEAGQQKLREAIADSLQKHPEFFPEEYQRTLVERGLLSPEMERQVDTSKVEIDPLVDPRFRFERLYPKQTFQLIKLGQDTTRLGNSINEINLWRRTNSDYFNNKFSDIDNKIASLGRSVTDASNTSTKALTEAQKQDSFSGIGSILGISSPLLIIGGIIVLVLLVRR